MYACWVQPESISDKASADATLAQVKALGLDTVMLCISASPVYYRSALLPNSGRVTANFDPLAYAISKCRTLGLSPHVWWCVGLIPKDGSFRARYPGLSCQDVTGDVQHWLYFGSSTAQTLCANVCAEIAAYGPDGVHLDVIRYQYDIAYIDWDQPRTQFQASHVTATVNACRAAMPSNVELTAAVFPGIKNATVDHLQPWTDWIRDGAMAHVMTMAYTDSLAEFESWLSEYASLPNRDRIVPGPIMWVGSETANGPKSASAVAAELQSCRAAGYPSFCLFDNRVFGASSSLDAQIKKETEIIGGDVMGAVQELRNEATSLVTEAAALESKAAEITAAAKLLRDRATRLTAIANGLTQADALADQLASAL